MHLDGLGRVLDILGRVVDMPDTLDSFRDSSLTCQACNTCQNVGDSGRTDASDGPVVYIP